ncbi:MAG: C2H2-type zinc finger protein, partial [Gammaproteobacteria bacterium]|nr:C2H2-type zinc finger protein [Gammaproteobacteria bacterium]
MESGIQPDSWGDLEEKFDTTPDRKELQVRSFFDKSHSNNSKSRSKEEEDGLEDNSIPTRSPLSTCKEGEPDRDRSVPKQGSSRIPKATISKQIQCAKNAQKHHLGAEVQRAISCQVCAENFTKSDNLKIHQRVHTRDRPFSCKVCLKSFKRSCDLKRH